MVHMESGNCMTYFIASTATEPFCIVLKISMIKDV